MEQAVAELKKLIKFKDTTEVGDVILMINELVDEQTGFAASYAVVTDFERDTAKRDEWWHVHLLLLTVPPTPQVLILQRPHFTGREIFTIGGKKVFIQAVDLGPPKSPNKDQAREGAKSKGGGLRVVK